jgi:uncharacterized OB-fold protein/acyl dehydratase
MSESTVPTDLDDDAYEAALQEFVGVETGPPHPAPDEVNQAMIRHWCEALGDTNPIYVDTDAAAASAHGSVVAPPAMLQAWVMMGINPPPRDPDNPYERLTALLAERGYTSVVATNCEQTYDRYLRPGDRLSMRTTITGVSPRKETALGTGHFVTTRQDYLDANGEQVGSMEFRIIRFRPRTVDAPPPPTPRPRPATTPDNNWWFEALAEGRLVVQACSGCGTVRHPPGPMCPECHSLAWEEVSTTGTGTVHSSVVVHHPQVPGFDYPLAVLLIDVDVTPAADGSERPVVRPVRMVMNSTDPDPTALGIDDPVRIEIREVGGVHLPFAAPATDKEPS